MEVGEILVTISLLYSNSVDYMTFAVLNKTNNSLFVKYLKH